MKLTDNTLRWIVVGSLVMLAIMHIVLIAMLGSRLSTAAFDEKLVVTPAQVMAKLEQIERDHKTYFENALKRELERREAK
jgi:hypothetical protein